MIILSTRTQCLRAGLELRLHGAFNGTLVVNMQHDCSYPLTLTGGFVDVFIPYGHRCAVEVNKQGKANAVVILRHDDQARSDVKFTTCQYHLKTLLADSAYFGSGAESDALVDKTQARVQDRSSSVYRQKVTSGILQVRVPENDARDISRYILKRKQLKMRKGLSWAAHNDVHRAAHTLDFNTATERRISRIPPTAASSRVEAAVSMRGNNVASLQRVVPGAQRRRNARDIARTWRTTGSRRPIRRRKSSLVTLHSLLNGYG